MSFAKFFSGRRRVVIFAGLMFGTLIILLPTVVKITSNTFFIGTGYDVQIDTVSYLSSASPEGQPRLVVGNLYHPLLNFSKTCPAVIACHGFAGGLGKETMARWATELAKRDYVVLCLDLAGQGSTLLNNFIFPSNETEPNYIRDGITYLKTLPYVNKSAIGLIGHSYGGATVCLAAGVLGDLVNATVALAPPTNWTDWFINDLLPNQLKIPSSQIVVYDDRIETGLEPAQSEAILNFLTLYKGWSPFWDYFVMPGTADFNRTTLRKFDAVEVLPNARNNSVMFIQGTQDGFFAATNQSGQGYRVTPNATFISITGEDHSFSKTSFADYALINFLDQKLKGVDITKLGTDNETYTQVRDIELTTPRLIDIPLLLEVLGVFLAAAVIVGTILNLFVYEKRVKPWRIIEDEAQFPKIGVCEDPSPDAIKRVRRPTYFNVFVHLSFVLIIFYGVLTLGSIGLFYPQVVDTFIIGFYISTYLAIRALPNDSELHECHLEIGRNNLRKQGIPLQKKDLIVSIVLVAGSGAIGAATTGDISADVIPAASLMRVVFFTGLALVVTAFAFLFREKKRAGKNFTWEQYHLSKARLIRGFTLGVLAFVNIAGLWQFIALNVKIPFPIAPHTWDYVFGLIAFVLFGLGTEIWIENILRSRFPMDGLTVKDRLRPRIKLLALGCLFVFIVSLIAFLPLLMATLVPLGGVIDGAFPGVGGLIGMMPLLVPVLAAIGFLIFRGLTIFTAEREVTFNATFYPLLLFWVFAFFLHI